jgi:hypothetical protein
VRYRGSGDICECARTKHCLCSWTTVRAEFDKNCGRDGCIGPGMWSYVLLYIWCVTGFQTCRHIP